MNTHAKLSAEAARLQVAMDTLRQAMWSARERLGEGLELSRTQLQILKLLADHTQATTRELAGWVGLTQSAVTQTVDTLVRRGLVARTADSNDRRVIHLALTPAGKEVTDQIAAMRARFLNELADRLTPSEREAFISISSKLIQVLETKTNSTER